MSVLKLDQVAYRYGAGAKEVFKDLDKKFELGRMYGIIGKSGTGKTTLLSLLAGLTNPTEGEILFEGEPVRGIDRYRYRSHHVGVVFQSFNLLPHLTALENVVLSMDISGVAAGDKRAHALELLRKVGLGEELAGRRVLKLSGGEQQRVAIARALSYNPKIILADEPTGNLDGETEQQVLDIFRKLAREEGKCVIIVTHDQDVVDAVDEVFVLSEIRSGAEFPKA